MKHSWLNHFEFSLSTKKKEKEKKKKRNFLGKKYKMPESVLNNDQNSRVDYHFHFVFENGDQSIHIYLFDLKRFDLNKDTDSMRG